jgi:hypothetical protein
MVVGGKLKISNRKKAELIAEMKGTHGFQTLEQIKAKNKFKGVTEEEEEEEKGKDGEQTGGKTGYEYLLGMNLWSLTQEKVDELKKTRDEKEAELQKLQKRTEGEIWAEDITAVELALGQMEKSDQEALEKATTLADKSRKASGAPGEKKPRAKAKPKEAPAPPPPPPEKPKLSDAASKLGAGLLKSDGGTDGLLARLLQRQTVRQERQSTEEASLKSGVALPETKKAKTTIECSACLAELAEDAKFCGQCGQVVATRLSIGGAAPAPSSTSGTPAPTPKSKAAGKKRPADEGATPSAKKRGSPGS